MSPRPAISVVVPLFNKERHIGRAIQSVLAQTMQDFEIVVVDDGSTDGSASAVEKMTDSRIRLVKQVNAGVSAARNKGVVEARNELIAFLDADDAYLPDFLEHVLQLVIQYPDAVAYALNYVTVDALGTRRSAVSGVTKAMPLDTAGYLAMAKFCSPIHPSSVAVRREALHRAGDFPVGVKLGEDLDTWLRLSFIGPVAFDPRLGCTYHLDADHRALVGTPPPLRYAFFDTLDRWAATQEHLRDTTRSDIEEFKNFFTIVHAHFQIRWGDRREGRRVLMACRTRVFRTRKWRWVATSFLPQAVYRTLVNFKAKLRGASSKFRSALISRPSPGALDA